MYARVMQAQICMVQNAMKNKSKVQRQRKTVFRERKECGHQTRLKSKQMMAKYASLTNKYKLYRDAFYTNLAQLCMEWLLAGCLFYQQLNCGKQTRPPRGKPEHRSPTPYSKTTAILPNNPGGQPLGCMHGVHKVRSDSRTITRVKNHVPLRLLTTMVERDAFS